MSALISSTSPDADTVLGVALLSLGAGVVPTVLTGSTDAIPFPNADNLVCIASSGVDACTLATPVAADEGKTLTVVVRSAHAHTVTTASGIILDGSGTPKTTCSFAAHAGGTLMLVVDNLFWVLVATSGTMS
jgi:hypothetical protein